MTESAGSVRWRAPAAWLVALLCQAFPQLLRIS